LKKHLVLVKQRQGHKKGREKARLKKLVEETGTTRLSHLWSKWIKGGEDKSQNFPFVLKANEKGEGGDQMQKKKNRDDHIQGARSTRKQTCQGKGFQ